MNNIMIKQGELEFTFRVEVEQDEATAAPWIDCDGHGPVSDWECRDHYKGGKRPGELILAKSPRCNRDGMYQFYNFAEAVKIARRDGWNAQPYCDKETKGQRAAKAALADFENLRAYCNNEWRYVGVIVTLLDDEGEITDVSDSLWAVEEKGDYPETIAHELAEGLLAGYGRTWGRVTRETFAMLEQEGA
jgi:hypothetical protein